MDRIEEDGSKNGRRNRPKWRIRRLRRFLLRRGGGNSPLNERERERDWESGSRAVLRSGSVSLSYDVNWRSRDVWLKEIKREKEEAEAEEEGEKNREKKERKEKNGGETGREMKEMKEMKERKKKKKKKQKGNRKGNNTPHSLTLNRNKKERKGRKTEWWANGRRSSLKGAKTHFWGKSRLFFSMEKLYVILLLSCQFTQCNLYRAKVSTVKSLNNDDNNGVGQHTLIP